MKCRVKVFKGKKVKLEINKKEVLRYLGYKNQKYSEELDLLIDEMRKEILEVAKYKYTYKIVELVKDDKGVVSLKEGILPLTGDSIQKHLTNSKYAVVMAATLGVELEKRLNYYGKTDLTKNFILDNCGTQMIEEVCDGIEEEVKEKLGEGYYYTFRYSPGYGDYPISVHRQVVDFLDGYRRIGLTVTPSNLLLPRKSVTAIMGVQLEPFESEFDRCGACLAREYCKFRKEGTRCYSKKD